MRDKNTKKNIIEPKHNDGMFNYRSRAASYVSKKQKRRIDKAHIKRI